MSNEQMLAALMELPASDMMTATKIDDPLGSGAYYRADTVVRLLEKEREKNAADTLRAEGLDAAIDAVMLKTPNCNVTGAEPVGGASVLSAGLGATTERRQ